MTDPEDLAAPTFAEQAVEGALWNGFTHSTDLLKQSLMVLPLRTMFEDRFDKVRVPFVVSRVDIPQDSEPSSDALGSDRATC